MKRLYAVAHRDVAGKSAPAAAAAVKRLWGELPDSEKVALKAEARKHNAALRANSARWREVASHVGRGNEP